VAPVAGASVEPSVTAAIETKPKYRQQNTLHILNFNVSRTSAKHHIFISN